MGFGLFGKYFFLAMTAVILIGAAGKGHKIAATRGLLSLQEAQWQAQCKSKLCLRDVGRQV